MGTRLTIFKRGEREFWDKVSGTTRFWVLMHASSLKWYVFNLVGSCVEIYRLVPVVPVVPTVIVSRNWVDIMAHGWSEINYTITEKKTSKSSYNNNTNNKNWRHDSGAHSQRVMKQSFGIVYFATWKNSCGINMNDSNISVSSSVCVNNGSEIIHFFFISYLFNV